MAAPRKMTANYLDPVKGWPCQGAVDFSAKISANVTVDLPAGRCVSLNDSGEFETGCGNGTTAKVNMPMWLFHDAVDPDVENDGGITGSVNDDPGGYAGITPSGNILALPAAGAYELATTEFEPESSLGSSYAPGDCLKAVVANTTLATGGRMTKGTRNTDYIVGTVSRAVKKSAGGKNVLSFWPLVMPTMP